MADLVRILAGVSRVPFLVLTPLCVLQGVALAAAGGQGVSLLSVVLVFVAALAAHILVNVVNEVSDFRSGLDLHTQRTPFSGGSGTLPESPEGLLAARILAGMALATVLVAGLWLVWLSGPGLLAFGAVGVLTVLTYSGWLSRSPWLCLLAPGIGFGLCMVAASEYALAGSVSAAGWGIATVTGLLASALLLMNQLPDRSVDAQFGRHHLAIAYGSTIAARVYIALMVCAAFLLATLVLAGVVPQAIVFAILPFFLLLPIAGRLRHYHEGGAGLTPALGMNVLCVNGALLLIVVGLWAG